MSEQTMMTTDEINRAIELRLFGNDLTAKTDEQRADAAWNWYESDAAAARFVFEKCDVFNPTKRQVGGWLWNHRQGQPWQSAIEQDVAAYHRAPRDFCGTADGMMMVLKAMQAKQFDFDLWHEGPRAVAAFIHKNGKLQHEREGQSIDELPLVVARAALAALEAQDAR